VCVCVCLCVSFFISSFLFFILRRGVFCLPVFPLVLGLGSWLRGGPDASVNWYTDTHTQTHMWNTPRHTHTHSLLLGTDLAPIERANHEGEKGACIPPPLYVCKLCSRQLCRYCGRHGDSGCHQAVSPPPLLLFPWLLFR
jgi:hypothetical protein